jgi:hypothetical protein
MRFSQLIFLSLLLPVSLLGCNDVTDTCFVAGTRIATPRATTPIELLAPGDSVISVDPITRVFSVSLVTEVRPSTADSYLEVATGGASVGVTESHPFATVGGPHFRPVGELSVGSAVWSVVGNRMDQASLSHLEQRQGPVAVYDLVTDREPHTFIAGSFLVHNKSDFTTVPITLKVDPPTAGWVRLWDDYFIGQGADTVVSVILGVALDLEAVPRNGWQFDHWEGDASPLDSHLTSVIPDIGTHVVCVFDTLR